MPTSAIPPVMIAARSASSGERPAGGSSGRGSSSGAFITVIEIDRHGDRGEHRRGSHRPRAAP